MFCTHCGSNVPDGTKFCTHCGAMMGTAQPVQPQPPTPPVQPPTAYPPYAATQNPTPGGPAPYMPPTEVPPYYVQGPYMPNYQAAQRVRRPRYINVVNLAGALLYFIGMFLPFFTVNVMGYSQSISILDTLTLSGGPDFVIMTLLIVTIVVLQIVKAPQAPSLVCSIILTASVFSEMGSLYAYNIAPYGSLEIGFWLMLIAGILMCASIPLNKLITKKG